MFVILLRHGVAEAKGGKPDAERRLTDDGKREMKRIARALAAMVPDVDAIYTSPLVRAQETARRVEKAYGERLRVDTTTALEPGTDPAEFRALVEREQPRCAYYVGHEPHLTAVMLDLTGMHADGELSLEKGGCYGLEWKKKEEPARLRWMLAPSLLE